MIDSQKVDAAVQHAVQLQARLRALTDEVFKNKAETAANLAHDVLQVRRLYDAYENVFKALAQVDMTLCEITVPEAFEREKTTTLNLKSGFRVSISQRFFASILKDRRDAAFAWLRKHKLGDLIQETVNAQTLSAAGRKMMEDDNKELPESLFATHYKFNTSITKIGPAVADVPTKKRSAR